MPTNKLLSSYLLGAMIAVTALTACYNPSLSPGKQSCSADGECPNGYYCTPDKHCYPTGVTPECTPACSGQKAICDKLTLTCQQCLANTDCPAGFLCAAQVCKPGCDSAHPGCAADSGACDVDLGVCRGCLLDSECPNATPRCEPMNGICLPCLPTNDNCPLGQYCTGAGDSYSCKSGCKETPECAAMIGGSPDASVPDLTDGGEVPDGGSPGVDGGPPPPSPQPACCAHQCTNLVADDNNCGGCGTACMNGQHCCSDVCEDFQTSMGNCGGCGMVCAQQNVTGPLCNQGSCDYGACNAGFADCDTLRANGCEINTNTDINNCGMCGNACPTPPNAAAVCTNGMCAISGCQPGFVDCDKQFANGCEINVTNDIANCGGCANVCPGVNNGSGACNNRNCVIATCNPGFQDCDHMVANGCEINTNADPNNCGACNNICSTPNATPTCDNGGCAIAACNPGFQDCDHAPTDGCEINTTNNINNCGACGTACTLGANATTDVCTNSACKITACATGFADCDGNAANGCEVNLTSDSNNCAACNHVCPANTGCLNSVCTTFCSVIATNDCTAKGWTVAAWNTAYPNSPGGVIYCVTAGASGGSDCNPCANYNLYVWKNTAKDACGSTQALTPGTIYGGHSPCACSPNDLTCGNWALNGCYPN